MKSKPSEYRAGNFRRFAETPEGKLIWEFLNREKTFIQMETASKLKCAAVDGIDLDLLAVCGPKVKEDHFKKMTGHAVKQIMEENGYILVQKRVRTPTSPVFTTGSRYEKTA